MNFSHIIFTLKNIYTLFSKTDHNEAIKNTSIYLNHFLFSNKNIFLIKNNFPKIETKNIFFSEMLLRSS